jgi:hypothetical protein
LVEVTTPLPYNGYWEVLAVPSDYIFRYKMGTDPGANASGLTVQYREIWRNRLLIAENNIIDVTTSIPAFPYGYGILLRDVGSHPTAFHLYMQNVIRGNLVRQLNDVIDPNNRGIDASKAKSGLTEQNVISMKSPEASLEEDSSLTYFANQTPSGTLLQGRDDTAGQYVDELTTAVQDSFILGW